MPQEPYHIFYCDDDPEDRDLFTEVLREINGNYNVQLQDRGNELLELLKEPPAGPHLIFLDLNMPGKHGFEVLEELQRRGQMQDLRVIILTTSNNPESIQKARDLGAIRYVVKPRSYTDYKMAMLEVLGYPDGHGHAAGEDWDYVI